VALLTSAGSNGVTLEIEHEGSSIAGPTSLTTTAPITINETVVVLAGDVIDFIVAPISGNSYCGTSLAPSIQFTTDGVTPALPIVSSLLPATLTISVGGQVALTVALSSAPSAAAVVSLSSSDATKATVPATVSVTVPAGQTTAVVTVTGVAVGGAVITATYNSSSKTATISVSSPVSTTWSNAPIGGQVLIDTNCSNKNGLFDVYGTTILDADATEPFSPPSVFKARLEALALEGGNQLEFNHPSSFREMYFGLYWRTNPQFQGRLVGNKLFFLSRDSGLNGVFLFGNTTLSNGSAPLLFGPNTDGIGNAHILGTSDPGATFFPNVGDGTLRVGVWTKIEAFIRASTTRTSQDGIVRWWINDVLVGSYTNVNYCGPNGETLNRWMQTQTWDGHFDMGRVNTVAWEHYIGHLRVVGKN